MIQEDNLYRPVGEDHRGGLAEIVLLKGSQMEGAGVDNALACRTVGQDKQHHCCYCYCRRWLQEVEVPSAAPCTARRTLPGRSGEVKVQDGLPQA